MTSSTSTTPRGLVVLDRDGVLNRLVPRSEAEPLDSPLSVDEVQLLPNVTAALRRLADSGYTLAIASNQPAAAKGKTTRAALDAVHARILANLEGDGDGDGDGHGVRIVNSFICYHRAEDGCACRKPRPGLLRAALGAMPGSSAATSWMVGDRATDVMAGAAAGFCTALLQGQTDDQYNLLLAKGLRPSFRGRDLQDFAAFLIDQDETRDKQR